MNSGWCNTREIIANQSGYHPRTEWIEGSMFLNLLRIIGMCERLIDVIYSLQQKKVAVAKIPLPKVEEK